MQQNFILFPKLLLFFILAYLPARSQEYNLTHYNTDNGLPQNSVKDIVKDKYGFIWLTTENGVARYDGSTFLVYKDFPINNQRFTFFYGNIEKDSILTGAGYHTVLLNGRTAEVLKGEHHFGFRRKYSRPITAPAINYNYHPRQGLPFYLSLKEGTYYINDSSLIFSDRFTSKETLLKITAVSGNKIMFFTLDGMLFHLDDASGKINRIIGGRMAAKYHFPLLTDKNSHILWSQINNTVFIVNNQKVYSLSFSRGYFRADKIADLGSINTQYLSCIFYDKVYRKLYLGSTIEGLKILNFHQFAATGKTDDFNSVFYSTLPYDHKSVITPQGGVYSRGGIQSNKKFDTDSQYFMSYDENKNIIVQDSGNLYRYLRPSLFTTRQLIQKTTATFVDFLHDDKRYYAIIRSPSRQVNAGKLLIYKDLSFNTVEKSILIDAEPTKLFKTGDALWVGTIQGLKKISLKTYGIKQITAQKEVYIRNIVKSRDGKVWITTLGKGFYLVRNEKLIRMPSDDDKNLMSPHTLLEDKNHVFWIPTNNGLYKVREQNLLAYAQNKNKEVNYYKYTKDAGFNTNEFNGGSNICGNILENGDFVLPSIDGLVFFNPLKTKSLYPENFYVERAVADGKEIQFSENLILDQHIQKTDIFVDVPYFANRNNVVIQLNRGFGKKWENIEQNMKFSLSNLSYGNHVFTLKMLTSDHEHFIYKTVTIRIIPYFYQTVWFKGLCILCLVIIIISVIKIRTRILTNKNLLLEEIIDARTQKLSATVENLEKTKAQLHNEIEQQKKLIGTITHDITTPIKFVALTVQDILDNETEDKEKLRRILTSIYKSSSQLYNFTLTLKEYADLYNNYRSHEKELYLVYDLIQEKKELFDEIAHTSSTSISNEVDPNIYLDINKNTLSVIIHNLLDNAVKFTKNGQIRITAEVAEDFTVIIIKDSGSGMTASQIEYYTTLHKNIDNEKLLLQKYGMGLHLVLQLIHILNGKIELENNRPTGTVFKITLKSVANE